jgi:mono/diheme cytochrome c family protein
MTRGGRLLAAAAGLAALGAAGFAVLTAPATFRLLKAETVASVPASGDAARGKVWFDAGGCASCHATPGQADHTRLGGGGELHTPFGVFRSPNLSPHPEDGIGRWTSVEFIRAMREGVSPDGRHYYPAFPYTSYRAMTEADLADLFAHLKTLPAVAGRAPDHDLSFPYSFRRGLGLWKLAFFDGERFRPDPSKSGAWNRGAYLVEGAGHCAECHSPRNAFGAIVEGRRHAGGPDPEGKGGFVPNLTPHATGLGKWETRDIAELLKSGFTPDFDSVGGSMAAVVRNTARLSDADREAMALYLKSLPPVANPRPKAPEPRK